MYILSISIVFSTNHHLYNKDDDEDDDDDDDDDITVTVQWSSICLHSITCEVDCLTVSLTPEIRSATPRSTTYHGFSSNSLCTTLFVVVDPSHGDLSPSLP